MASRLALLLAPATLLAGPPAMAQRLFTGSNAVCGNVQAGLRAYAQACVSCHGQRLEGSPFGPTLIGPAFQDKWRDKPAAQLLTQMQNTMPPKGSTAKVDAAAFPDLLAFLVMANMAGPPPAIANLPQPGAAPAPRVVVPKKLPAALTRRLSSLAPVTDALLAAPPDADWLAWRRTQDAHGFSPLRQIDRGNVARLRPAWSLPLERSPNEITPLVHDGVLFVYSGGTVLAVDAAGGTPLWSYERGSRSSGQSASMKSLAIRGRSLFVATPDGHMVALDARSGKVLWDKAIAGVTSGSGLDLSSGPVIARGVLMIGTGLGLN